MKRTSKPKTKTPSHEKVTKPAAVQLPMDERPLRYAIAGGVILLFGIFYWVQNLFEAYNFNDFGEYYTRAEDWTKGIFNTGASDILLSVLEYIAILMHPHDFLASIRLISQMLIVLVMSSSFLFIVRRNEALPDFWTKLALVMLTLSIPHFIFATITIDHSLLFAACLLFVLSTYNIRWAGIVSVIAFFSRPEAIIILPLYALLFWLDKNRRKDIAINALSFVALLALAKWLIGHYSENAVAIAQAQEFGFVDRIGWDYIRGFIGHTLNIPIVILTYAYECLQNTFLWVLFILGIVLSVRQRNAYPFYGVLLFFLLAYITLYADGAVKSYSHFNTIIRNMRLESDYFIVKAFNKFDPLIGHGRYRLVLYPAFAYFVVMGAVQSVVLPIKLIGKKSVALRIAPVAAVFMAALALFNLAVAYRPIQKEYNTERKLARMHPVYKMGIELRKQAGHGAVFIDNFCDETDGSVLMIFSTYSGRDTVLTRFCKYGVMMRNEDGRQELVNHKAYQAAMPANPYLLAKYYRSKALKSEMYDSARVKSWEGIMLNYNDSLMQHEGITHVLAARAIPVAHLEVVDSVKGGGFIHKRLY